MNFDLERLFSLKWAFNSDQNEHAGKNCAQKYTHTTAIKTGLVANKTVDRSVGRGENLVSHLGDTALEQPFCLSGVCVLAMAWTLPCLD